MRHTRHTNEASLFLRQPDFAILPQNKRQNHMATNSLAISIGLAPAMANYALL